MKTTQIIGSLSLLALVIALAIVLTGQKTQVESLLAPGDANDATRSKAASDSVVGEGQLGKASSELGTLVREAIINTAGSTTVSDAATLEEDLIAAEPSIPLGQPIDDGGYQMSVAAGGKVVIFCARPNYYSVCAGVNLASRARSEAKAARLNKARQTVLSRISGKGGSGDGSSSGSSGGAAGAIEKIRELQKKGGLQ